MRISGSPEFGKATQGFLLVSALAILASGCTSETARFGNGPDGMTTGSISSSASLQSMVPPENVGGGGYQTYPVNTAAVAQQPVSTTNGNSGVRMATAPVSVQSSSLPPPPSQQVALAAPANPANTYSSANAVVGAPSTLPSAADDGSMRRVMMRGGETLNQFAARNGVTPQEVLMANGLTSEGQIRPGQVLLVPQVSGNGAKAAANSTGLVPNGPTPVPTLPQDQRVAVIPTSPGTQKRQVNEAASTSGNSASNSAGSGPKPAAGGGYTVQSGDSLYKIALANGVSVDALKQANGLSSSNIRIGQTLTIPGAGAVPAQPVAKVETASMTVQPQNPAAAPKTAKPATPAPQTAETVAPAPAAPTSTAAAQPKPYQPPASASADAQVQDVAVRSDAGDKVPEGTGISKYRWPVTGAVVVRFGQVNGDSISEGIDISVPQGTPIKAAENGVVVYADDGLADYGNAILIRHDDGRVTVYGYAEKLNVKRGDHVQRGQTIAVSGMTGKAKQPMVHFEVRDNTKAVDPMPYLG